MLHATAQREWTFWHGANDFGGTVTLFKPPLPKRKTVDRQAGGMSVPVETRHGFEKLTCEATFVGMAEQLYELVKGGRFAEERFYLRAAFEDEVTGQTLTEVHTCEGRCIEHDLGDRKPGEDLETKLIFALVFWTHEYGGRERYYFDALNNVVRENGVPLTDAVNAALGRGG